MFKRLIALLWLVAIVTGCAANAKSKCLSPDNCPNQEDAVEDAYFDNAM